MSREYRDYVTDIIDAIKTAQDFTNQMNFESFSIDKKTIFAITRALEIVGEAIKKIPVLLRKKYPSIPWKDLAGMRDKLIHNYSGVNLSIVWETVTQELPRLLKEFERVLQDLEESHIKK